MSEALDAPPETPPLRRLRRALWRRLPWITTPALVIAFLLGWDFYVRTGGISHLILPPPAEVWVGMRRLLADPRTLTHISITLMEILGGFGAALLVGVSLGLLFGKVEWAERTARPFIVATQVVPKIALIPLFILWFGFGPESKVLTAAVLAFFPILTNTLLGVRSIDRGHRDAMRSMGATPWQAFLHLELPSALPYILSGMQIGIVMATIGAVVGEYLGGNVGLGYLLVATLNAFDVRGMFAVVVLLALIGFTLYSIVAGLRRWLTPWHGTDGEGR